MENKNNEQLYLFHQGTYYCAYEYLGAHPFEENERADMYLEHGRQMQAR